MLPDVPAAHFWKSRLQRVYMWALFLLSLALSGVLIWSETFAFIPHPPISIAYVFLVVAPHTC
jgi:hypothetical protein